MRYVTFQLVFLGLMKLDVYCEFPYEICHVSTCVSRAYETRCLLNCEFPYEICHVSTNIKIIIHVDSRLDTGYFSQYT